MLNVRGSVIQGFHVFKNLHPGHRQKEIEVAIEKGIRFLENKQVGGLWYGYGEEHWGKSSESSHKRFQLTEEDLSRVESVVLELLQKARDVKDLNASSENNRSCNWEPGVEYYSCESLFAVVTDKILH
ncbi:dammarenediol II synthase-like protein [Tanacetum coccineum]